MHRRTLLASAAAMIGGTGAAVGGASAVADDADTSAVDPPALSIAIYQTRALGEHVAPYGDRWVGVDRVARVCRSALAASGLDATVRAVHEDVRLRYRGDSVTTLDAWRDYGLDAAPAADANLLLTSGVGTAAEEGLAGAAEYGGQWALCHNGPYLRFFDGPPWLWAVRDRQSVPGAAIHEIGHNLSLTHFDGEVRVREQSRGGLGMPATSTCVSPMVGNYYPDPGVDGVDHPPLTGGLVRERAFSATAVERIAAGSGPARLSPADTRVVTCRSGTTLHGEGDGGGGGAHAGVGEGVSGDEDEGAPLSMDGGTDVGAPPRDVDVDGRVEDVTGDGSLDVLDVAALLDALDHPTVAYRADRFDFDGDGSVTASDVAALLDDT